MTTRSTLEKRPAKVPTPKPKPAAPPGREAKPLTAIGKKKAAKAKAAEARLRPPPVGGPEQAVWTKIYEKSAFSFA